MDNSLSKNISAYIKQENLPQDYMNLVEDYFKPLAQWMISRKQETTGLVIGINGGQGSGKSTLAGVLALILEAQGYKTVVLSIDDLYLSRQKRLQRAQTLHPLFSTRGVPGTHDVKLGVATLEQLISGEEHDVFLPQFDKSKDDLKPKDLWPCIQAPVDIVLFEGWCVATPPQMIEALCTPINALEAEEDKDASWRTLVNELLAGPYQQLFDKIDGLVFLKAPSFCSVLEWRSVQEQKTFKGRKNQAMDSLALQRFIQHYERLTRLNLEQLPALADVVLSLDARQKIIQATYKKGRKVSTHKKSPVANA